MSGSPVLLQGATRAIPGNFDDSGREAFPMTDQEKAVKDCVLSTCYKGYFMHFSASREMASRSVYDRLQTCNSGPKRWTIPRNGRFPPASNAAYTEPY